MSAFVRSEAPIWTFVMCIFLVSAFEFVPSESSVAASTPVKDEFSWLEETNGVRATRWVQEQNARTYKALKKDARYAEYLRTAREAQDDDNPATWQTRMHDGWIYEVTKNAQHPRGLWRRTTLRSYLSGDPTWAILLDIDAISRAEGHPYVIQVVNVVFQSGGDRCMVALQDGGAPFASFREFDLRAHKFVDSGFNLPADPEGNIVEWEDADTLLVGVTVKTLSGPSNRWLIRRWKRGQHFSQAAEIFSAKPEARGAIGYAGPLVYQNAGGRKQKPVILFRVGRGNYRVELWSQDDVGQLARLRLPESVRTFGVFQNQLVLETLKDWRVANTTWPGGSFLSVSMKDVFREITRVQVIRTPGAREAPGGDFGAFITRTGVLLPVTRNVQSELWGYTFEGLHWTAHRVPLPENGMVGYVQANAAENQALTSYESLVQPPQQYAVLADGSAQGLRRKFSFDSSQYVTKQFEAKS